MQYGAISLPFHSLTSQRDVREWKGREIKQLGWVTVFGRVYYLGL